MGGLSTPHHDRRAVLAQPPCSVHTGVMTQTTGNPCRDSLVTGVRNQGDNPGIMGEHAEGPCMAPQTHTLNGKGLCEKHWKQGLNARKTADQRALGYRAAVASYNH